MAGEERRRSQRVIIRVPVTLVLEQNGQSVKIPSYTVAVNIHGAMVLCNRAIDENTELEVQNSRTGEKIGARTTRAPRESPEGYLIPVEFVAQSTNFWQISFPPTNWKALDN